MSTTQYNRSRGDGGIHRVFVDITASLMLASQRQVGISPVEDEIARRLLLFSTFNFIPVVFGNGGLLFALNPEQVATIFSSKPVADSQELRRRKRASSLPGKWDAAAAKEREADRQPRILARLKSLLTSQLRYAARVFITLMPYAVREDVLTILIHARRIVRTLIHRHSDPVAASIPAHSILPTLQMVVHPRSGDVLWTAGPYNEFVPLRAIGEMRARSGLRVVAGCYRLAHPRSNSSSMAAELFMADAVALLDASDLVLALSERTRRELFALAARLGRESPAVQLLQIGSGLRQWFDPDSEDSRDAPAAKSSMEETVLPDSRLWDEIAVATNEGLQMLLAETAGA
jgi:hypothetical protein